MPESAKPSRAARLRAQPGRTREAAALSSQGGATVMGVAVTKLGRALWPHAGDKEPYLRIDRAEGLAAATQTAALQLYPWNSAPGTPDGPGRLVFELDPAPDLALSAVVEEE